MKKVVLALVIGALALVAAGASTGTSGRGPTALSDLPQFDNVEFITVCKFTRFLPDDPIVHYKMPGMSHDHSFFGNTTTNAFSTLKSLQKGATSCQRPEDTASYWAPTLLLNNKRVTPVEADIYYRRSTLAKVRPFPQGLKIVAGNAMSLKKQSEHVVFWNCSTDPTAPSITIPSCPTPSLHVHVRFPNCWDGTHLDSPDHHSHMAYSKNGFCPKSHPVAVPQIMLIIQYPVASDTPLQVASGGQLTGHADFFNAWKPKELKRLVDYCLNALRACGAVS
jgi:hypothetical protein